MLALYFSPGASSMAPHIALHEIGVPFTPKPISFNRREQRGEAFLRLNPEGKVPTLLIDGRSLAEVAGILYYLGRAFPEAGLFPSGDAEAEAQVVAWMSFVASTLHPARRQGPERVREVYTIVESKLSGREWVGDRYSIADIHLFRLFWRVRDLLLPTEADFPTLSAHYDRMMARPAVQHTIEIEAAIGYETP